MTDVWRICSTCKKPIDFEQSYYACSVSTCNRKRLGLFFCSLPCWDAHVPAARHRDAWAVEQTAPSREQWQQQQQEEESLADTDTEPQGSAVAGRTRRRVVGEVADFEGQESRPSDDVLIVVTKLKKYVRARSGMNTSDNVFGALSDHLRYLCDQAVAVAAEDQRKTVMQRDFAKVIERLRRGDT